MTKKYFQLTLEQRYSIESLKTAGFSQTAIAIHLGFSKSTISRGFSRNIPKRGIGAKIYVAVNAQKKSFDRHRFKHKATYFSLSMKRQVRRWLKVEKLSPEFISAQWIKNGQPGVSPETIYKWIWHCKFSNQKKHSRTNIFICI